MRARFGFEGAEKRRPALIRHDPDTGSNRERIAPGAARASSGRSRRRPAFYDEIAAARRRRHLGCARTGAPWRDLRRRLRRNRDSVLRHSRFWRCDAERRTWEAGRPGLVDDPDFRIRPHRRRRIVQVHRHGTGAKGDSKSGHRQVARRPDHQDRSARRCVDSGSTPWRDVAKRHLVRFMLLPAERHDITGVDAAAVARHRLPELLIRATRRSRNARWPARAPGRAAASRPSFPLSPERTTGHPAHDAERYTWRHLI